MISPEICRSVMWAYARDILGGVAHLDVDCAWCQISKQLLFSISGEFDGKYYALTQAISKRDIVMCRDTQAVADLVSLTVRNLVDGFVTAIGDIRRGLIPPAIKPLPNPTPPPVEEPFELKGVPDPSFIFDSEGGYRVVPSNN